MLGVRRYSCDAAKKQREVEPYMYKGVQNGGSVKLGCHERSIVSIRLSSTARAWQYRGHVHWLQAVCGLSGNGGVGATTAI
jgi:hypothetical protein